MATANDLRKLALALEGATEVGHFGSPSFRVGGRIFAQMSDKKKEAILKLSPAHQELLFEVRPEAFSPEIWGNIRWTRAMLGEIPLDELKVLVREAYDQVAKAPKRKTKR
ncbi:MAG TPA: MmcQ/YjbR family DNA-binding protein [Rhizomicrobium sp.]|jgi:predicted DNA-binding protein (MmcQ/YjbR family)|nr:MmcQ/YjbR family DNA-binding protein [Rhizomicrobium sp.]